MACAITHSNTVVVKPLHTYVEYSTGANVNYFPLPWKHATVITIPKPGKDLSSPVIHRPISLLNTMSKVLEKLLLVRLKTHTTSKLRPDLHDFRSSLSKSTQLRVIDDISFNLNLRKNTTAILLDVEKVLTRSGTTASSLN